MRGCCRSLRFRRRHATMASSSMGWALATNPTPSGPRREFPRGARNYYCVGGSQRLWQEHLLLKLAARFYDVDQGTIRIGGVDIRDLGSRAVLDSLAMVFQYVYLFEDTLYENPPGLPQCNAGGGAPRSGGWCHRDCPAAAAGFDTLISEGGQNLSGGERQRVSIARALLKDARIVLLDEATSSLDVQNEHLVMRGMKTLSAERTIVVIAHRLHTIRDADQIVMMSPSGTVESIGNHEELMEVPHATAASGVKERRHQLEAVGTSCRGRVDTAPCAPVRIHRTVRRR